MSTSPRARSIRAVAVTLTAIVAVACGESALPTGPTELAPQTAAMNKASTAAKQPGRAALLRRLHPLATDEVACRNIDPARTKGGVSIALKEAGLRVTFPLNSVPAPTRICLTAHAGWLLAYTFEPHGLQFNTPITVQQDLRGTTAARQLALAETIFGGYLKNGVTADVNADGVGRFEERFPTAVAPTTASFSTVHFSGYAVASGFVATDTIKLH
jgi:hypothetical protein